METGITKYTNYAFMCRNNPGIFNWIETETKHNIETTSAATSTTTTHKHTRTHKHTHTQAKHSKSRGENMSLEGRFKPCYGSTVSERVGQTVPE